MRAKRDRLPALDGVTGTTALHICFGYPSFMGPGVPKERVEAIRAAYVQTLKDPEFIAAVLKGGLDIDPISAEEITDTVRSIYSQSASAVEQVRELLTGK